MSSASISQPSTATRPAAHATRRGSSATRRRRVRRRARVGARASAACPSHSGIAHGVGGPRDGADAGDRRRVVAEQHVGSVGQRHRALRVGAEREAGDAQRGGLLLHPAGVGEDRARRRPRARGSPGSRCGSMQRTPAASRRVEAPPCRPAARACAGGSGRRPARARRARSSAVDDPREARRVVDVRGPVQRDEDVGRARSTPARVHAARSRARRSQRRSESIIVLPT